MWEGPLYVWLHYMCAHRVPVCLWGLRYSWALVCAGRVLCASVGAREVGVGVPGSGGGFPVLACPQAWAEPRLTCLTCLTCLPQLSGEARSPAPRVGRARFLATEPELPSTSTSGARVRGQA